MALRLLPPATKESRTNPNPLYPKNVGYQFRGYFLGESSKVNGVWQAACYPFREGLSTGILNVEFTPGGKLLCGGTNRGRPVRGVKPSPSNESNEAAKCRSRSTALRSSRMVSK